MNLEVKFEDKIIFSHNGKWLHPLFALEDFLSTNEYLPSDLLLTDKIIGRGAAVLISKMMIKNIHAKLLSRRAIGVLDSNNIKYTYDEIIDSIKCITETILTDDKTLDKCYQELKIRAGRD
ncbi:MAG: DUF1893 domain-containing protein [Spirochaetaceae bacterium]